MTAGVGTQLGHTILVVAWTRGAGRLTGLGPILAGIIQTSGLSHAFGCWPLGAIGWTLSAAASVAATGGAVVVPRAPVRPGGRRHGLAEPVRP